MNDLPVWARYLAGRCVDGFERDGGTLWHAVPKDQDTALCGATYGRRSAGWCMDPQENKAVTCPKCLAKIARIEEQRRGPYDLAAIEQWAASKGYSLFRYHSSVPVHLGACLAGSPSFRDQSYSLCGRQGVKARAPEHRYSWDLIVICPKCLKEASFLIHRT